MGFDAEEISDWLSDWAANQIKRSRRSASKRKIADSAGEMPNRTEELARSDFLVRALCTKVVAKRKSEEHVANPAHRPVPPAPRVPGSRSARGAVATNRGARANARRAARALRASLGASRRDESLIAVGTQKPTFICPTGRASVRGGRGGMSTASASATDVGRVRPTEKYWTDYEDWKVRPPTRSRRLDTSVRPERTKKPAVSGAAVVLIISRPEVSWKNVFVLFLKDRLTAFRAPHAASHTSVCRHS